ncbi:triphosphoribosyl-dephospho-CoA synthase [Palaeococcus ferrophilus]|uniref:triphosphoribosyl-dephospho-CoA synthase n=1 Tax=Palaeococcus ferrophilus TaxID=83868 RepID=UPI00064F6F44|nr:triphosphoribosyl-dephospho-CoA synthase [Palaeococcus ferrophilus]
MERWKVIKAFTLGPLLEATIPKPGNVNRYHDFEDLTIYHFLFGNTALLNVLYEATEVARLVARGTYDLSEAGIGELIKRAVAESRRAQGANPNFGVVVLEVPLIMALSVSKGLFDAREIVKRLISASTVRDTMELYRAIRIANPKGIPSGVKYDVYSESAFDELFRDRVNLWALAEMSCERELIFCEWLNGYELSYQTFLRLKELVNELGLEEGTLRAFVELLASRKDTLIARKAGEEEALLVMQKAREVLKGSMSVEELDNFLREKGDLRNPGSLADVTAIALSLLVLDGFTL